MLSKPSGDGNSTMVDGQVLLSVPTTNGGGDQTKVIEKFSQINSKVIVGPSLADQAKKDV